MGKWFKGPEGHGWLAKCRKKHSREPGVRGELTIGNQVYALSGWVKLDQFKQKYVTLAATSVDKGGVARRVRREEQ